MINPALKAAAGVGKIHLLIVPNYRVLQTVVDQVVRSLHALRVVFHYQSVTSDFQFPCGSIYKIGVVDKKPSIDRFMGYTLSSVTFHPDCFKVGRPELYDLAKQVLLSRVRDQSGVHSRSDAAQYTCNQPGESEFSMSTSQVSEIMPTQLYGLFDTKSRFKPLVHFAHWITKSHLDVAGRHRAARVDHSVETYFKIWNAQLRQRYGYEVIENWATRFVKGPAACAYWGNDNRPKRSGGIVILDFESPHRDPAEQHCYGKPNGGRRTLPAFYTSLSKYWVRSNGEVCPPDTMNQGHLENTAKLLRESHSNVQGQCSELLGKMRAHFRNSPQVCAKIDALLPEMLAVPVEQMYPVLLTLMKNAGFTDPPPVYDPKDIAKLDGL